MKRSYLLPVIIIAISTVLVLTGALAKLEGWVISGSQMLMAALVLYAVGIIWLILAFRRADNKAGQEPA